MLHWEHPSSLIFTTALTSRIKTRWKWGVACPKADSEPLCGFSVESPSSYAHWPNSVAGYTYSGRFPHFLLQSLDPSRKSRVKGKKHLPAACFSHWRPATTHTPTNSEPLFSYKYWNTSIDYKTKINLCETFCTFWNWECFFQIFFFFYQRPLKICLSVWLSHTVTKGTKGLS